MCLFLRVWIEERFFSRVSRKVILTGCLHYTNSLSDHCMVDFVKPNLLGSRKEFCNRFVNPITNGQCADASKWDVKLMKKRAHILHETLAGCVQVHFFNPLLFFKIIFNVSRYVVKRHTYIGWSDQCWDVPPTSNTLFTILIFKEIMQMKYQSSTVIVAIDMYADSVTWETLFVHMFKMVDFKF